MKRISIISFLVIFTIQANAQTGKSVGLSKTNHTATASKESNEASKSIKIGWGESNKVENDLTGIEVFGDMNNGIFSIRTKGKHIYFIKYTGDLKVSEEKELTMPTPSGGDAKDLEFKSVLYLQGNIFLALTYYNKADKTGFLYLDKISHDGDVDPNLVEVDKIEGFKKNMTNGNGSDEDRDDAGLVTYYNYNTWGTPGGIENLAASYAEDGFKAVLSEDSSKILFYHHATADKKDLDRFSCTVTGLDLKQLWSKTIELPYANKEFALKDIKVDNEGDAVFEGTKKLDKDEKVGKAKKDYRLVAYYWEDKTVKEYTFDLGLKIITNLYFTFDKDNNIRVGGFYSNKSVDKTDGYYFATINKTTKEVESKITNDFEADFADKFKFATKKGELKSFVLNNIYSSPNGNLILIAEQREVEQVTTGGGGMGGPGGMGGAPGMAGGAGVGMYGGMSMTNVIYIANDILVFCLTPEGKLIWTTTIPKKQRMAKRIYVSYVFLHDKDNLYFMYNDNPENSKLDRDKVSVYRNQNKTAIMLATITADGSETRKELPQPEENDDHLALKIKMLSDVGNKNYALVGRARKQYRIGIAAIK